MALSDEIKERLDIVDVVSNYVPTLRKAGRSYKSVCPFHTERTPSFVVFPERQSWRCFGACATGGDVLSFVMRMEKLGFGDTIKLLAHRAGVTIPKQKDRHGPNILHSVNETAMVFFQELLQSQVGIAARAYLHKRGLEPRIIERFQLGLSPSDGSSLTGHLSNIGYTQDQIMRAGLTTPSNQSTSYDMFRGRLMFPILDDKGNIAGFGGRSLEESQPKYLNSPRTEIFDKSGILYAFHWAKKHIVEQGEGVVVEGYMDAITAHQHGFNNVVASMGTSLTASQVTLLRSTGRNFVLAMDPDAAGQEATFRSLVDSWRIFERKSVARRRGVHLVQRTVDISLKIAVLPDGNDPDAVIRSNPASWSQLINQATPLLDYLFASAKTRWDLASSEGKAKAAEELYPIVSAIENPFEQEQHFRRLASTLNVEPSTLEASLGRPYSHTSARPMRNQKPSASTAAFDQEHRNPLDEYMLGLVLQWPELRHYVQDLDPQAIERLEDREVFTYWINCPTIEALIELLEENLRQRVHHLLSIPFPPMALYQRERAITDCSNRLEERRLRNLKAEEALLLDQTEPPRKTQEMETLEQQVVDTNEKLLHLFYARSPRQRRD